MNAVNFIEKFLGVKLSYYQKELIMLIESNPRGYLNDVIRKHPSQQIKTVAQLYTKYEQRTMAEI